MGLPGFRISSCKQCLVQSWLPAEFAKKKLNPFLFLTTTNLNFQFFVLHFLNKFSYISVQCATPPCHPPPPRQTSNDYGRHGWPFCLVVWPFLWPCFLALLYVSYTCCLAKKLPLRTRSVRILDHTYFPQPFLLAPQPLH